MRLPGFQVASLVMMFAIFIVDFFINILERGWNRGGVRDGESEAVSGAWGVVWVLTEDDDLDLIEVGGEGTKDLSFLRKNGFGGVGISQEAAKFLKIGFIKL